MIRSLDAREPDLSAAPDHPLASVEPVVSDTRRSIATANVRRALLSGVFAPGQRIREVELARALGISRPTVREALQQLVHEGILVAEPYKGVRVAEPTARGVVDATNVRTLLEVQAARELAEPAHEAGRAALRAALARHLAALDGDDEEACEDTHLDLHRAIWEGSGNAMLKRIWPLIVSQVRIAVLLDEETHYDHERYRADHERLVATIEGGDPAQIEDVFRHHIRWRERDAR